MLIHTTCKRRNAGVELFQKGIAVVEGVQLVVDCPAGCNGSVVLVLGVLYPPVAASIAIFFLTVGGHAHESSYFSILAK